MEKSKSELLFEFGTKLFSDLNGLGYLNFIHTRPVEENKIFIAIISEKYKDDVNGIISMILFENSEFEVFEIEILFTMISVEQFLKERNYFKIENKTKYADLISEAIEKNSFPSKKFDEHRKECLHLAEKKPEGFSEQKSFETIKLSKLGNMIAEKYQNDDRLNFVLQNTFDKNKIRIFISHSGFLKELQTEILKIKQEKNYKEQVSIQIDSRYPQEILKGKIYSCELMTMNGYDLANMKNIVLDGPDLETKEMIKLVAISDFYIENAEVYRGEIFEAPFDLSARLRHDNVAVAIENPEEKDTQFVFGKNSEVTAKGSCTIDVSEGFEKLLEEKRPEPKKTTQLDPEDVKFYLKSPDLGEPFFDESENIGDQNLDDGELTQIDIMGNWDKSFKEEVSNKKKRESAFLLICITAGILFLPLYVLFKTIVALFSN